MGGDTVDLNRISAFSDLSLLDRRGDGYGHYGGGKGRQGPLVAVGQPILRCGQFPLSA